ncbi:hypothetical protein Lal_00006217 [Lupinus albus]|nr:hypothetical protein Lal_00006217 [Lupinus albus]
MLTILGERLLVLDESIPMTKYEHLNTHLMMEFNPSKQITAHNRTESIMTTFASKFRPLKYRFVELWLFMEAAGGLAWLNGFCFLLYLYNKYHYKDPYLFGLDLTNKEI